MPCRMTFGLPNLILWLIILKRYIGNFSVIRKNHNELEDNIVLNLLDKHVDILKLNSE